MFKKIILFILLFLALLPIWAQPQSYTFFFPEEYHLPNNLYNIYPPKMGKSYEVVLQLMSDNNYEFYFYAFGYLFECYENGIPSITLSHGKYEIVDSLFILENGNHQIDEFVELYENGDYEIIRTLVMPAKGSYESADSLLLLKDSYSNVTIAYKFRNNALYPVRTFPFLNHKLLSKDAPEQFHYNFIAFRDTSNFVISDILAHYNKKEKTNSSSIDTGTYYPCLKNHELLFAFHIKANHQYALYHYGGFLLSSGRWQQQDNLLILYDTSLHHNYYAVIMGDTLKVLFFDMKYWDKSPLNDWIKNASLLKRSEQPPSVKGRPKCSFRID
ncbi:MAG: hypothetical protein LBK03_00865 [Bacteroidales bacterium]|nr:hypothetical protein [Bacteroidales bacterium]